MARVHWKGSALLAPVPSVLVTSGTMEKANVLTVGWTGVVSTRPPRISISLRPERHSHGIIRESGEFVVNLVPAAFAEAADWCGTVTGRCVDKIRECGMTLCPSETVAAPTIADCPLSLECRVFDVRPMGSHDLFLADVTGVSAEESLLDEGGRLRLDRAKLLVFSHGEYFEMGRKIGPIGLSVANKKKGKFAKIPGQLNPSSNRGRRK